MTESQTRTPATTNGDDDPFESGESFEDFGPVSRHDPIRSTSSWGFAAILRRIAVVAVASLVVVELLLHAKQSQSAATIVANASLPWLAGCLGATALTYLMATIATIGSTPVHLPRRPTFAVQLASSFVNRLVPGGVAGTVVNVRFVERSGAGRTGAIASSALNNVAGLIVHLVVLVAFVPFFGGARRDVDPPDNSGLLLAVLVVLVGGGAVAWIRWIPHHWKRRVAGVRVAAVEVLRSPRRIAALVGGSAGITAAHALGLWCALHSVGGTTSVIDVTVVYLVAAAAASLSPTPGGLGAIEIALVTGLSQTGTPAATAAAAVILYRLISYWLPVAPGYVAFRSMRRGGYI
ncbi:MAG: YbhN family protein [Acidimicrobiia bacterium]